MPELMRSIAARLRAFIGNRRHPPRYEVRLPCGVTLFDSKMGAAGARRPLKLQGYTRDISTTGMALILPSIRIGEYYLTGEDRKLLIELESPPGPVQMQAVAVRYEPLDDDNVEKGYLIGIRITEMSEGDSARFKAYVRTLP